jgi:MoaA/NifB/PqqE/SkfB family radical SAM enzyme
MEASMKFLESGPLNLLSNTITKSAPLYVQYYVTARCNLRCEQCNVIYANADRRELNTEESFKVIDNLAELGTSVVLLTGGEPFIRKDLPKLAGRLIENGVHPRIQTNGLATFDRLRECADNGVRDISISLDSLVPSMQDKLNGGFESSWNTAIETVSNVGKTLGENTFAAFGCVFSPTNFREVPSVIRFATEIGWWVSLVPAHVTEIHNPRSFSTFNKDMIFRTEIHAAAEDILDEVIKMKHDGYNVYDSDQFLIDMKNFVTGRPTTWRNRNNGICDAGELYMAVLPDGTLAPCCDWRLEQNVDVADSNFVNAFRSREFSSEIKTIASRCNGCLYGSYPEISISARFMAAALERVGLFIKENRNQIKVLSPDEIQSVAARILKG